MGFNSRREGLTSEENRRQPDPSQPGDATQGAHTAAEESDEGADGDEDGGTGAVRRHRVEADGDAEDPRAGDEDPVCGSSVSRLDG